MPRRGAQRPTETIEDFARSVRACAGKIAAGGGHGTYGDNKVFIAYLWAQMRLAANRSGDEDFPGLQEFKGKLLRARRAGLLELSRADLVGVMDPALVAKSRTQNPGGDDASHVSFVVV
jgi:hypothetical protein